MIQWIPSICTLRASHTHRCNATAASAPESAPCALRAMTMHAATAAVIWQVLIPNAHPGYLSWEEFESSQQTLRRNFETSYFGSRPTRS